MDRGRTEGIFPRPDRANCIEDFHKCSQLWAPFIKNWTSYGTSVTAQSQAANVLLTTMKIALRYRLIAVSKFGMPLVFDGVEGCSKPGTIGIFGGCGTMELALRGVSGRASATEEHSLIGAAEEVVSKHGGVTRRSSDESNQV
jgi:hypothetical protein